MNPLVKLRATLLRESEKKDALRAVTVESSNGDGTSLVRDLAGNYFTVNGEGVPAGQRAIVQGETLGAQIPALPVAAFYV